MANTINVHLKETNSVALKIRLIFPEKKLPRTAPRFVITNKSEKRWTLSSFEVFSARKGSIDIRSTSVIMPYKREKIARIFELRVID
jgi:hypothetical protein